MLNNEDHNPDDYTRLNVANNQPLVSESYQLNPEVENVNGYDSKFNGEGELMHVD